MLGNIKTPKIPIKYGVGTNNRFQAVAHPPACLAVDGDFIAI